MCDLRFRHRTHPGCTEEELHMLVEIIISFKNVTHSLLSNYQAYKMGTFKWHVLYHLVEYFRTMGCVDYLTVIYMINPIS